MNKKLLTSLIVIGVVGALAGGSTLALFSDTETSSDNVFTAGAIDLALGTSNGGEADTLFNGEDVQTFFEFDDVKPGDTYERTVAFNVTSNPYYGCVHLTNAQDLENSVNEPEADSPNEDNLIDFDPNTDEDGTQGELGELSSLFIWAETDGDNVYEPNNDEPVVINRTSGLPLENITWTLADANENIYTGNAGDALQPETTYYLGVEYGLPIDVGNEAQTDSYSVDATFEVVQHRNNEDFVCNPLEVEPTDDDVDNT